MIHPIDSKIYIQTVEQKLDKERLFGWSCFIKLPWKTFPCLLRTVYRKLFLLGIHISNPTIEGPLEKCLLWDGGRKCTWRAWCVSRCQEVRTCSRQPTTEQTPSCVEGTCQRDTWSTWKFLVAQVGWFEQQNKVVLDLDTKYKINIHKLIPLPTHDWVNKQMNGGHETNVPCRRMPYFS